MLCLHPITIKNPVIGTARQTNTSKRYIDVPCGKCANCLRNKSNDWAFRLYEESQNSSSPPYFITLTYDDEHIIYNDYGWPTFSKEHIQKFFKSLRHKSSSKLSYFLCSEYGAKSFRPHYHLLLFNYNGNPDFISQYWKYGFVSVGNVTPASINYTCKYFCNPQQPTLSHDKPFMMCSKGIGKSYCTESRINFYNHNVCLKLYTNDGRVFRMGRYIKNKLGNVKSDDVDFDFNDYQLSILDDIIDNGLSLKSAVSEYNRRVESTDNVFFRHQKINTLKSL